MGIVREAGTYEYTLKAPLTLAGNGKEGQIAEQPNAEEDCRRHSSQWQM